MSEPRRLACAEEEEVAYGDDDEAHDEVRDG
jgi:hypothetical protein